MAGKVNNEKNSVIWAACDAMLQEGREPKEITGRNVVVN